MTNQNDVYKLANGVEIPCIGFGMWQTPDDETGVNAVKSAIRAGYTHIDTAQAYGNEDCVRIAIEETGVDRKDLFITTKLWNSNHSYDLTMSSFEESLKKLGTDYVDLFLIHWPNPAAFRDHWQKANAESWKAMEELYEEGRIRAIGISNFRPHHIDALLETAKIKPMVNQIRLCPGETQDEIVDYSRAQGMILEAYSPLGTGKIFDVPQMKELSQKYDRSIAQICIRWSLQRGYLPLPKSVTPSRIEENLKVFDFELEESDVRLIEGLTGCVGLSSNPDSVPF
ncbi:aldo/keto reductase [Butyrivibrio sp. NC3005]|uniref:aldo/keto reductase n=1 Tax=Butyrivibrio sp. NC3005 TaxID=1280685 RepID=UPI00041FA01D|nr:aldo/keto reductase [Butyrivibrio sp. NC3005]